MVLSLPSPHRRRLLLPFALVLAVVALLAPAAAAPSTAAAAPVAATHGVPVLLARAGAGTHSFGGGRSYGSRRYGYGYGRGGNHSFARGLFVGWTLGHFFGFGGGIPLFPLLFVLLIAYLMLRGGGRRGPRRI
jgi:hypothetical protein